MCRRSVSGSAFTTRFLHDWCDSFCARDPPTDSVFCPLVRHLFGTTRSRLARLKDDKQSRCAHLRALALHGARERLRPHWVQSHRALSRH